MATTTLPPAAPPAQKKAPPLDNRTNDDSSIAVTARRDAHDQRTAGFGSQGQIQVHTEQRPRSPEGSGGMDERESSGQRSRGEEGGGDEAAGHGAVMGIADEAADASAVSAGATGRAAVEGGDAVSPATAKTKRVVKALDAMRAYRACLNCRNRKSKCDLDINGGRPPCRRCQRENKDCILGESHRGGRRHKKQKIETDHGRHSNHSSESADAQAAFVSPTASQITPYHSPDQPRRALQNYSTNPTSFSSQIEPTRYGWQRSPSTAGGQYATGTHQHIELPRPSFRSQRDTSTPSTRQHENITSADLQNPSDALEILAQVADRAEDGETTASNNSRRPTIQQQQQQQRGSGSGTMPLQIDMSPPSTMPDQISFQPLASGAISLQMVHLLFSRYERLYHPYFPIIPQETFDRRRLPWISRHEPHLFSAILTIGSKDNEPVHQTCYEHMQGLVSLILAGADAGVEAVEALLLMSQWVSHRPQASAAVGRGEEDRVAWMYIGTALRLGYFLGLDRTSFRSDVHDDSRHFHRKKLVWASCYICDRQVSVRLGRGFWSRGLGPLSGLRHSDFPTLQAHNAPGENRALLFQAWLEMTQIFSNVYDVLYSTKYHGWKQMLEGRYVKFLDDFRTSIRHWHDNWANIDCADNIRTALFLSYDYLRVYVNAFAYQAAISRALIYRRDSITTSSTTTTSTATKPQSTTPQPVSVSIPRLDASASDARFIYEAVDAATSLLNRYVDFPNPEPLRYMPSAYYLYIIYSAVFLYKARSTTSMAPQEQMAVRRTVKATIERFQTNSMGPNHMGSRYARLLRLLWRKAPEEGAVDHAGPDVHAAGGQAVSKPSSLLSIPRPGDVNDGSASYPSPNITDSSTASTRNHQPTNTSSHRSTFSVPSIPLPTQTQRPHQPVIVPPPSNFSWLDLGSTWNFATQKNGGSMAALGSGSLSSGELDDGFGLLGGPGSAGGLGGDGFDVAMGVPLLTADYSLLESDNPNFIF